MNNIASLTSRATKALKNNHSGPDFLELAFCLQSAGEWKEEPFDWASIPTCLSEAEQQELNRADAIDRDWHLDEADRLEALARGELLAELVKAGLVEAQANNDNAEQPTPESPTQEAHPSAESATGPPPIANPAPIRAALAYAERSWRVVPLLAHDAKDEHGKIRDDAGKRPIVKDWPNAASADPKQIRSWNGEGRLRNIGVATGHRSGFVALDIDPRNGGNESLAALIAEHGELPPTLEAKTGGGGRHILFAIDRPVAKGVLAPGIDFQADGAQIVVAPSRHRSGKRYEWVNPQHPLAECPAWVLELADRPTQDPPPKDNTSNTSPHDSRLAHAFARAGLLGSELPNGVGISVTCPWEIANPPLDKERRPILPTGHHARTSDTSAAIFPPKEPGGLGGFNCKHSTCAERGSQHAIDELEARERSPEACDSLLKLSPASVAVGFPWAKLLKQKKDIKGRVIGFSGTIGNAMTVLAEAEPWQNVIGYDEFANEIVLHREPPTRKQDRVPGLEYPRYWSSEDTTRTVTWLTDLFRVEIDPSKVRAAVFAISKRHAYHPVRAWLHSLPVWDGTPRIDRLFVDYMGAEDTDYVRSIGGKFMIGLVARAETPGCKLDTMPIAEGLQGKLKSSALRALMPVAAWFSDTPIDFGSKDAYQCLNGKWLIEIAELDGFDKWDARRIKSFVSSAADYYRPSYGEKAVNFPRQCVFTGTTNDEQYLHDRSGGRRFWPFSVRGKVDLAGIERDREQLFAEALARFRAGDRWWLTETEEEAARIEQGARTAEDPWEGRVVAWLAKPQRREFGHLVGALDVSGGISASEVAEHALGIEPDRQTHSHTIRVGCALKSAGWVSRGKARPRRYFPPA